MFWNFSILPVFLSHDSIRTNKRVLLTKHSVIVATRKQYSPHWKELSGFQKKIYKHFWCRWSWQNWGPGFIWFGETVLFGFLFILASMLAHERSKDTGVVVVCGPGCRGWIKSTQSNEAQQGLKWTNLLFRLSCCVVAIEGCDVVSVTWLRQISVGDVFLMV